MPKPNKWKFFKDADEAREYVVLLSYLPLKKFRTIPRFLRATSKIEKQLSESQGLIGYSLHAELLKKKFWTLSVWEDRKSLGAFVSHLPHRQTMIDLAYAMSQTKFTDWAVKGSDVPPDWDGAKRHMASE